MAVQCASASVEQLLNINSLGFSLCMGSIYSSSQELNCWVDEDLDLSSSMGNVHISSDSLNMKKSARMFVSAESNVEVLQKCSNAGVSELHNSISTFEFGDDKENVDPRQFVFSSDVGSRQTMALKSASGKRAPLQDITSKLQVNSISANSNTNMSGNSSTMTKKVRTVKSPRAKASSRKHYMR